MQHVWEVPECLLQHQLYMTAGEYEFRQPSVSFLGFILAEGEVKMDSEKVSAVKDWPTPTRCNIFWVFAKFYTKSIRNSNMVASVVQVHTKQELFQSSFCTDRGISRHPGGPRQKRQWRWGIIFTCCFANGADNRWK